MNTRFIAMLVLTFACVAFSLRAEAPDEKTEAKLRELVAENVKLKEDNQKVVQALISATATGLKLLTEIDRLTDDSKPIPQGAEAQKQLDELKAKRDQLRADLKRIEDRIAKLEGSASPKPDIGKFKLPGPLEKIECDASMLTKQFEVVETKFYPPGEFRWSVTNNLVDSDVIVLHLKTPKKVIGDFGAMTPFGKERPTIKFYEVVAGNDELVTKFDVFADFVRNGETLEAGKVFKAVIFVEPEEGSRKLLSRRVSKAKFFLPN
ncbi:MAG: hypothetical protein ACKV2Q_30095 [Planctomycetaceae bacterium]